MGSQQKLLLTHRQQEMIGLIACGFSNAAIQQLSVDILTVKSTLRSAYRKLGVSNRQEAVHAFLKAK